MTASSKEALKSIVKTKKTLRDEILNQIKLSRGWGLTLSDLCHVLDRPVNELSGRVSELYKSGKIKINGQRTNPRTKKNMSVWVLSQLGTD